MYHILHINQGEAGGPECKKSCWRQAYLILLGGNMSALIGIGLVYTGYAKTWRGPVPTSLDFRRPYKPAR